MNNGWIKIHRKLLDWEWWDDHNTSRLFFYLILKANHKPKKWRGIVIERGQILTGRQALSKATGISEQSIRTSLSRLKSTNEVTIQSTRQYSIISICNYDSYQITEDSANQQPTNNLTNSQPTTNQQLTTNKNVKNDKNEKNISLKSENLKKLVRNMYEDETWQISVRQLYPELRTKNTLKKALNNFVSYCESSAEYHNDEKSCRRHFTNWFKYQN